MAPEALLLARAPVHVPQADPVIDRAGEHLVRCGGAKAHHSALVADEAHLG